jgi:hypothetical protein
MVLDGQGRQRQVAAAEGQELSAGDNGAVSLAEANRPVRPQLVKATRNWRACRALGLENQRFLDLVGIGGVGAEREECEKGEE